MVAGVWASLGDSGGGTVRGAWGDAPGAPQDDLQVMVSVCGCRGISQILLGGEGGPESGSVGAAEQLKGGEPVSQREVGSNSRTGSGNRDGLASSGWGRAVAQSAVCAFEGPWGAATPVSHPSKASRVSLAHTRHTVTASSRGFQL